MQLTYRDASGNDQTIRITFAYGTRNGKDFSFAGRALSNIHNKRVWTFANISIKQPDETFKDIAGSYVSRSPLDQFIKATGRRMALGNAVSQLEDRNMRKFIWDEYFKAHKDGKKIMASAAANVKAKAKKLPEPPAWPPLVTSSPRKSFIRQLFSR